MATMLMNLGLTGSDMIKLNFDDIIFMLIIATFVVGMAAIIIKCL